MKNALLFLFVASNIQENVPSVEHYREQTKIRYTYNQEQKELHKKIRTNTLSPQEPLLKKINPHDTLLYFSARSCHMVELLDAYIIFDPTVINKYGENLFYHAVGSGSSDLYDLLALYKARNVDPCFTNHYGHNALHNFSFVKYKYSYKELEKIADALLDTYKVNLFQISNFGENPLMMTIKELKRDQHALHILEQLNAEEKEKYNELNNGKNVIAFSISSYTNNIIKELSLLKSLLKLYYHKS